MGSGRVVALAKDVVDAGLELIYTVVGDVFVSACVVVVGALALCICTSLGGFGIGIAVTKAFTCVVEALVDVSTDSFACTVTCVEDAV